MGLFSLPRLLSSSFHLRRFSAKSVERVHNVWISGLIDPNKVDNNQRSITGQIEKMHRARSKNEMRLNRFKNIQRDWNKNIQAAFTFFTRKKHNVVYKREIPEDLEALVLEKRRELIEVVSRVDDKLAEAFCNGRIMSGADLQEAIRRVTIARKFIPVFMGGGAFEYKHSLVALAFTLKDRICQMTYLRVFEGVVWKGDFNTNVNTGKTFEVPEFIGLCTDELEVPPHSIEIRKDKEGVPPNSVVVRKDKMGVPYVLGVCNDKPEVSF